MFRKCLLALAAASAAAALRPSPSAAFAEDAPAPAASLFATKSPDVSRQAAAKLWAAANEARRASLFGFARREATRVVAWDPEHREARALLGFAKKDGAWTEDPALAAKTPKANFGDKPASLEAAAAAERKWMHDALAPARTAVAALWANLADECTKRGDAAGAKSAHERALAVDPDLRRSREALGWYRFAGAAWLTEAQFRRVESAVRAQTVDDASPADKALGVKLTKVETPHFRVEGRLAADRLGEIAKWLETAYAVHLADLGRDPTESVFPARVRMIVCDTEADWTAYLNGFVTRNRDFYRTLEGVWGENWIYGMRPPQDGSDETRRDHLVHRAIHAVDNFALGIFWPSWADEGLSHLTTIRVQGMTRTWCVGPSKSDYAKLDRAGGKAGWIDEDEWRAVVRASAAARDDLPLRTLLLQPFQELGFPAAIKAWSILAFWRDEDPALFRSLLPKLRGAKAPDRVVEEHFGRGLEEIDEEWRRYVLRTY